MKNQNDNATTKNTDSFIVEETAPKYKPLQNDLPFEEGKRYTYSDYCTWGEDLDNGPDYTKTKDRYELYEGIPIVMEGANRRHQEILGELFALFHNFLKGKPCKVFVAPFDVRLNADGADNTVVQPDILIVCDHSKLTGKSCNGAPDMTIEILSPGSIQNDRLKKFHLYEKYGVREYWIIEPESELLTVYLLRNGRYVVEVYNKSNTVPVNILEGCEINLADVFDAE